MIGAAAALAAMRGLPVADIGTLLAPGPFLVLAPHPDDESLGCGGLIAAACARGRPPVVLVVTDGAASHPASREWPPVRLAAARVEEARAAVAVLGLPGGRIGFLGEPDTRSPLGGAGLEAAAARVAERMVREGVATILATWVHDPHCDHVSAHLIAARAAALAGVRHLAYPVWGWTLPDTAMLPGEPRGVRVDVAEYLPLKRRAIAAHRTQYAGLVADDPAGFQLPPGFVALFDGAYETLLEPDALT